MKKIALMSAILAVSFSSMVFADNRAPVPQDQYPTGEHHKGDKKPSREVPPPKHKGDKAPRHDEKHDDKHQSDHAKKPPLPENNR
ncbi:hypothetical protein [Kosakonia oryziphila]|jgi:hypothetical protein|uniref:Acid shock protein n=1 Tax=Kosakonia oryziphila TaxID=1005667 RepID=A0A1C4B919_9ENTR|nr:hypothetical protein [Kosakonia oryziphila]SCC03336.1 hypothetical protein GA0061070_100735 [Kosakonia oryziphila]